MSGSADIRPRRDGERGIALVVVLWVMALLSVLAIGFAGEARTGLQIARNQFENARARALAETGVSLAILGMAQQDATLQWRADGRERRFAQGDGEIRIRVQDEAGKIDLNAAPEELLLGLFRIAGLDPGTARRLADAIADWKDPDDLRRPEGAESGEYRAAGRAYAPRNGPFLDLDELRLVLGMTGEVVQRVRPFLTVWSRSSRVNPLTAPVEVLASLPGISPEIASAYVEQRTALETSQLATLPALLGADRYLARVAPQTITVTAEGITASGAAFTREAAVQLSRSPVVPYRILAWRQGDSR